MTAYPSGPWKSFRRINADGLPEVVVTASNGCPLAIVGNHAEREKTALVIVAAPDLLAAALRMAAWIEREAIPYLVDSDDNPGEALRMAIAKAEERT
ncbi:UNVERIFIED_ORG: hypothetical protein LHK14_17915 [Roseateles sp. XES5]|nr:hypothetical protein [Roseateles sp. XES5]